MFCVGFEVVGVLLIVCFLVANVLIMEKVVVKEDLHGPISIKLNALMDVVRKKLNVCFWVANALLMENNVVN